ncbi:hypothetical protein MGA3_17044 [Bacillus methanolicus MGA3]|uniref:Uncharacterized protein n=1 Tax=Bacillus methanolicus (strain MGA3 / ATCC 53907) TaxID=796606 RepID=I3DTV5_BACMM|nr:hypothetical protein BMMGA3_07485 [Bacillus methanolicus MGA3]EIJ77676.1 hypothetical protein MGA3_17044 [Bacillus methanolicus MGA3]
MKLSLLHPRILRSVCSAIPQLLLHDRSLYPVETAIEDYIHLIEWKLRQPGSLDKYTYYRMIYELGEGYQQVDRFHEAEYCSGMLNEERVENG